MNLFCAENCCADGTMNKSQENGKADGNQANKQNVPSNEQLDYVYRVLRPDEDPSEGLQARDPNATDVKPSSHVHGQRRSPFISTCATLEAAEMFASLAKEKGYQTGHLVRINIKKLKEMADVEIIVLNESHFSENDARGRNYALKYRQVLIRGEIPAECIDVIDDYEESEEYDIEDYSSGDQQPDFDEECDSLSEEFAKKTKLSDSCKYSGLRYWVKEGKYQESIQSSTTPDTGYQWESDNVKIRHHKREPRSQPFPSR